MSILNVRTLLRMARKHNIRLKPGLYDGGENYLCVIGMLGATIGMKWKRGGDGRKIRFAVAKHYDIPEENLYALENGFDDTLELVPIDKKLNYNFIKYYQVGQRLRKLAYSGNF
jgi:hypothetical protein